MSELTNALMAAAMTGDQQATAYIKNMENQNFAQFLQQMCVEFGTATRDERVRTLAGLNIKNSLDARNEQAALAMEQRWKGLPEQTRQSVKTMLVQILQDPIKQIRHTAALVIGKIAAIEIPAKAWPDLISTLDHNITKQTSNAGLRQSSLEALGYVCEEVPNELQPFSNQILSAIASGMDAKEQSPEIKHAATVCLANAIEFIKTNMESKQDRDTIFAMIFSVTASPSQDVRVAAYQCLVQIADSYYQHLAAYMGPIFQRTTEAIQSALQNKEVPEVAMQAIEFWSTVGDVELECMEEDYDLPQGEQPPCQGFIRQAVGMLTPVLLQALTQQNEDPEDDEWGVSLASATCIGLCAQVSGDAIVPHVLPFVQQNVGNSNWRFREAAILAFGCILDGPDKTKLTGIVRDAFGIILGYMKDPNPLVRDTAAWTIGRICSIIPDVVDAKLLPQLMDVLIAGVGETPKIASHVCWAIHELASAVDIGDESSTSPLSPYFQRLVAALLNATTRQDVKQHNLQVAVYEAINVLVSTAAPDTHKLIQELFPLVLQKLNETLKRRADSAEDREEINEIQALLSGTIQAIVTKLDQQVILPHADALMQVFLHVLKSKNSTVHEEALMAVGAVADKLGEHFIKYLEAVKEPVMQGLTNAQEHHVCSVAVHVTNDIASAVGVRFIPWSDEVMKTLLEHLQNASIERTVKAYMISCMGDIALAVGGWFERYMPYVTSMLKGATSIQLDPADSDNYDYLQLLRGSIVQAYSSILLGLSLEKKVSVFVAQNGLIESIINDLLLRIANDKDAEDKLIRGSNALIYDLANLVGPQVVPMLKKPHIEHIIKTGLQSKSPGTQRHAQAAQKALS